MLKLIFLMLALGTLFLNTLLTYYLIRSKGSKFADLVLNEEIVSFDLSQYSVREVLEATDAAETEVIMPYAKQNR